MFTTLIHSGLRNAFPLRKAGLALIVAGSLMGFTSWANPGTETKGTPAKLQGVLIDELSSHEAETRVVSDSGQPHLEGGIIVAYTHTRQEALKPDARKSGYGVFTYETNKFVPFDEESNRKAVLFFEKAKQDSDFRVEVTGEMHGDRFHVTDIQLLP